MEFKNIHSFFGLTEKDHSVLICKRKKENIIHLVTAKIKEKYKTKKFYHTQDLVGQVQESSYINSFDLISYTKNNICIFTSCDKINDLSKYISNCYSHTSAHRSFEQRIAICLFINDFGQVIHNLRNLTKKYIFNTIVCPIGEYHIIFMKKKLMPKSISLLNEEDQEKFMAKLKTEFDSNYIDKRTNHVEFYVKVLIEFFAIWNISDLTKIEVSAQDIKVVGIPKFMLVYFDNVGRLEKNVYIINFKDYASEIDLQNLISLNELKYCTTNNGDEPWGN